MSSYFGIFKMSFKGELQYRMKAISGVATQFFWGIMYVYLYTAFMKGGVENFTISQMASYIWLGQAFFAIRFITLPKNIGQEITNGDVCYRFVRPISLYNNLYATSLGEKLSQTLLRCLPIMIITLLLPANVGLMLPVSFPAFCLFLLSLIIGWMLTSAIAMLSVYLTFKTLKAKGSYMFVNVITMVLGGAYVPIPLMPQVLQTALNYMPFRYITDLPFRIYIGNIGIQESLLYILISLAWLVGIILIGKLLIKLASKKAIIQGG